MKNMIPRFFFIWIYLTVITANCLVAQVDSFKVVMSVTPITNELKSGAQFKNQNLKNISTNGESTTNDFKITISGASKGFVDLLHNTYPDDIWQRMEWEHLEVSFFIEANFVEQVDDILNFRIVKKYGTVLFQGTATQHNFENKYTYNFGWNHDMKIDIEEGLLQYSMTNKKIKSLSFLTYESTGYPMAQSIEYINDTIYVQFLMPPDKGWWFTNSYSIFSIPQPEFNFGDQFPIANFTYSPTEPPTNGSLTFDASSSKDPDSVNPYTLEAQWDFGDGTTGIGKVTNHTYATPGEYEVCLTIIDIHNLRDKICKKINFLPTADFTYDDVGIEVNNKWDIIYSFKNNSSSGIGQTITDYLWDFGDGETSTAKDTIHRYLKGGNYTVSLTVTNSAGQTNTKTIENCVSDIGFRPQLDGWKYPNLNNPIWPESYWRKFDYNFLNNDPTWVNMYKDISLLIPPKSTFPDWPLFVDVFGREYCYVNVTISRTALEKWNLKRGEWGGSCFGFSISSLLFFNHRLNLNAEFASNSLFNVNNTVKSRDTINKYQLYQWDYRHQEHYDQVWNKYADKTIMEIQKSFDSNQDNISICIGKIENNNLNKMHSVVPYKIITHPKPLNKLDIYIYDSGIPYEASIPKTQERIITYDISKKTWNYDVADYSKKNTWGIFDNMPVSNYIDQPVLKSAGIISRYEVLLSNTNDILIFKNNEALGYYQDSIFNKTTFGTMIYSIEPFNTNPRPKGYYLDYGDYKAILNNFETTMSSFAVFSDTLSFFYKRFDTSIGQKDVLFFGPNYFKVVNKDETKKSFNFMCIFNQPEYEKVYEFNDVEISPGDTISYYFSNSSEVKMETLDSATTYRFRANILIQTNADFYPEKKVSAEANSTQTVIPSWEDINNEGVIIKVDNGNDGTTDKTLNLNNFTNISAIDIKLLATVYPNPSKGKFKIECGENVNIAIISVYDIMGNEIMNYQLQEKYTKWTHELDLTSFLSGVYLLKIITDKKVFEKILLKN